MMTGHRRLPPLLIVALVVGCSRGHYRRSADAEAYGVIGEKSCGTPWEVPPGFTIRQAPDARVPDPPDLDHPPLPPPQPRLHAYQLPAAPPDAARQAAPNSSSGGVAASGIRTASAERASATAQEQLPPPRTEPDPSGAPRRAAAAGPLAAADYTSGLPLRSVPETAWQAITPECLARMLEFPSIRNEYSRTFSSDPPSGMRDQARRLTLPEIVELAVTNSREYQIQKEALFRSALALTLERFAYAPKFSNTGNGTTVDYDHVVSGGHTVETLSVPTRFQAEQMLATGGALIARFANDVVLTFGGPNGFTSDVGSELLFRLTQPLLQRDIRLEPLIQAERNVVYAARDFARFRRSFFFQRASEYYGLLRTYRQIEIDAQNYFSLVRAFNQAEAEERAGLQSRMQVEQIEQSMLLGRSRLSTTCNSLETALDRLNIAMGLPTELPINIDLSELEQLTRRDEIQVAGERASRAQHRLEAFRREQPPNRTQVLNASIVLNERVVEWLRLQQGEREQAARLAELEELYGRLRVSDARLTADRARQELASARGAVPASPPIVVFQRTMDALDALLVLLERQQELALRLQADAVTLGGLHEQAAKLAQRGTALRERLDAAVKQARLDELERLLREADQLRNDAEAQVGSGDRLIGGAPEQSDPKQELRQTLEQADRLLATAEQLMRAAGVGLVPVKINSDDAMLTALVDRLDLMNERGRLADDWRAIKLTADDLRSVLNLNAEQRIRTEKNRPFGFTFDESETRLALSLDLPLNRLAQRNRYRLALIDYQAGLRRLVEREDTTKLAVRDELRTLTLAREQYLINIAGAALAAERVLSTRLELTLGFPGVAARDFLEAQDAYSRALSLVADNRIAHIKERMQLFLDLELMLVDPSGFWPQLHDERFQPSSRHELPPEAGPPYGTIPEFLRVSHEIRDMIEGEYSH